MELAGSKKTTVNLVLVHTANNNYFSLCTNIKKNLGGGGGGGGGGGNVTVRTNKSR